MKLRKASSDNVLTKEVTLLKIYSGNEQIYYRFINMRRIGQNFKCISINLTTNSILLKCFFQYYLNYCLKDFLVYFLFRYDIILIFRSCYLQIVMSQMRLKQSCAKYISNTVNIKLRDGSQFHWIFQITSYLNN